MPNIGGVIRVASSSPYSIGQANQGNALIFSTSASIVVTLATPTDASFYCWVYMSGVGSATLTPASGTINGGAALVLTSGQDGVIFWDGANWEILLAGGPGTGLTLETNGTLNSTQTLLNLVGAGGNTVSETAGTVTITGSSNGGANPSKRRWAYGVTSNNNLSTAAAGWVGDTASADNGASFEAAGGGFGFALPVSIYTVSSTGSDAGITTNLASATNGWCLVGNNTLFQCKIGFSILTSIRFRAGMGNVAGQPTWIASDSLTTVDYAAFRFSTAAGDTHFMCETGDGSAVATADSGITPATLTLYLLQIQFNSAVPNVVFSINGSVVATATTHLPRSGKPQNYYITIKPIATQSESLYVGWVYEESDI